MYHLNLRLPPEVGEALKADAEERGMTISTLIRRLISEHLAENGKPVKIKTSGWGGRRAKESKPADS